MTRSIALALGIIAAIAAWIGAPFARPDIADAWFIGTNNWRGITLHGHEIVGAAVGLAVWVLALHVPRRGKVIAGIRIGAAATVAT